MENKKFKLSKLEIFIIFMVAILFALYFYPNFALSLEQKQYGRMQTNAAMMTSKILAVFSDNTVEHIPTQIAEQLAQTMNNLCKNPVNKKNPAYSVNQECEGCVVLTPDDKQKTIILTAKDTNDALVLRTIIQPPSFVTYNKDLKQK